MSQLTCGVDVQYVEAAFGNLKENDTQKRKLCGLNNTEGDFVFASDA
jgi:hypothetical protein